MGALPVLLQDTLAFIVRVYAVLLTAQAPLLYGIRQVRGRARVWAANPHPTPKLLALALALTLDPTLTLLYGIRQIESAAGLRPFCAVYALVFGGTAAVRAHSRRRVLACVGCPLPNTRVDVCRVPTPG